MHSSPSITRLAFGSKFILLVPAVRNIADLTTAVLNIDLWKALSTQSPLSTSLPLAVTCLVPLR